MQIRLPAFDRPRLELVGRRVRDIYRDGAKAPERIDAYVDDAYVAELASAVGGELGGRVGIVPRVFLRKLVGEVLDKVDDFEDFRPREHYALTVNDSELTLEEREARARNRSADDVELQL